MSGYLWRGAFKIPRFPYTGNEHIHEQPTLFELFGEDAFLDQSDKACDARAPCSITSAGLRMSARIQWLEDGIERSALWWSEKAASPPPQVILGDDSLSADKAIRLASQGFSILWRGDFQNARHLLQAMARRIDRRSRRPGSGDGGAPQEIFYKYRQARLQRARTLAAVLIPVEEGYRIPLRRAPDLSNALAQVHGPTAEEFITPLSDVLGFVSAFEWRKKGIHIPALAGLQTQRIYPHYGVFPPTRQEYVDLVADMTLPASMGADSIAFDIGTGTGLLAALLVRKGVARVVATDIAPRSIACARENFERLGVSAQIDLMQTDLFPRGNASLIVCNPPWIPAQPASSLETAIYDPQNRMLYGFIAELRDHLLPGGEGWLVLSDLAEHLGLRTRAQLLSVIADAGLKIVDRSDCRPTHAKAADAENPLHFARSSEVTSLWRLVCA